MPYSRRAGLYTLEEIMGTVWDRIFMVWPTLVLIGLFFPSMTTPLLIVAGTIFLIAQSVHENRR